MAEPSLPELEARLEAAAAHAEARPRALVDALNDLAWALRGKDVPRAHELARQARGRAQELGHLHGQARAARTMAMTVGRPEHFGALFELAEEAHGLFAQTEDTLGLAGALDFLASIHEHTGNLAKALPLALEALSLARAHGDPVRQGYALSSVGGILTASGEYEEAIRHLEEAFALFERAENPQGLCTIASRLAVAAKDAGRPDDARRYAQLVLDHEDPDNDGFFEASAIAVLAELEARAGDHTRAADRLREALARLRSEPSRNVVGSEIQVNLARQLAAGGDPEAAERELRDALDRIEGNGISIVTEAAAHEALADLCEQRGDLAQTVHHLRREQALRDELAQRNARNRVAQVEARAAMDAAKKDAEIHKLRFVELHGMQAKLLEAEKMAVLGKLAAGTAHELNTPLGVLRSNAGLVNRAVEQLAELVDDDAPKANRLLRAIRTCRETSEEALARIGEIAKSYQRFTRLDEGEEREFDVNEGLESALALLVPTLPDGVRVERRFAPVAALRGWPRELNHAFMTVLDNAAQAISGEGRILVESLEVGDEVHVHVTDTGRGMSPETVAHLFDVGWAADGPRAKMRLGLSAAYATARRHGGTIEVKSTLGEGTTVTFRLPLAVSRSTSSSSPAAS